MDIMSCSDISYRIWSIVYVIVMWCAVLVVLSREENSMGRLLKTGSEVDKTRAGKMMAAVAKAQNYSSQQLWDLLSLRVTWKHS